MMTGRWRGRALSCLSLAKNLCATASTVSRAGKMGNRLSMATSAAGCGARGPGERESYLLWLLARRFRTCIGKVKLTAAIKAAPFRPWGIKTWWTVAHVAPT
jgi:hypothetical protein